MKSWAIISTAFALLFLVLFLRTLSIPSGGGQIKESPSGKFVAIANSLQNENPLSADSKGVYYELRADEFKNISNICFCYTFSSIIYINNNLSSFIFYGNIYTAFAIHSI